MRRESTSLGRPLWSWPDEWQVIAPRHNAGMDGRRLGSLVRAVRVRKGLRQQDVADVAGVSRATERLHSLSLVLLERHGVTGPSQVMWGIHDQIRAQWKQVRKAAESGDIKVVGAYYDLDTGVVTFLPD